MKNNQLSSPSLVVASYKTDIATLEALRNVVYKLGRGHTQSNYISELLRNDPAIKKELAKKKK